MRCHYQWCLWLLTSAFCWVNSVRADIPITVTATIVEPVCQVTGTDGSGLITVDFGNVQVQDINTTQARQPLEMKVTCESAAPSGKVLQMLLEPVEGGVITVGGEQVLGTSLPGLGIRLDDVNGMVVTPGRWTRVSGVDTRVTPDRAAVVMQASLVAENTNTLEADTFRTSATLVMTYL
ncbi:fimbrial protein [Salmonella enterica subsp. salamae]|nr:fimbrial protein [Salmonella enterica subsp. salamae serovar Sofia]EBS4543923.1 fimbrial protein [Salmonella enterica subsp. salamae serovar Sofia]